jgi:DNA-binding GntR family transcriptional regulator
MASNFIDNLNFSPQMIGQQLAKVLMDAIVTNEIHGGEKLVEHQLQKKFGVSRSPIREAIRDLEKIGLVEIIPRKGTVVKEITKKDVKEDYAVRAPLEGLAAKEAYSSMDNGDLARLDKALVAMRAAVKKKNLAGYWRAHADFHDTFINASGNGLLSAILRVLRIHSLRSRLVYPYPDEDLGASLATHEEILKRFKAPDTDVNELERLVIQHIHDALPGFLANMT